MRLFFGCKASIDNYKEIQNGFGMLRAKWVERQNIHLTLLFIGEAEAAFVLQKVARLEYSPQRISLRSLSTFGTPARILFCKPQQTQQLHSLHRQLAHRLDIKTKPYTPHVTLARIKKIENENNFEKSLQHYQEKEIGTLTVQPLLIASTLTPKGPQYEVIKEF